MAKKSITKNYIFNVIYQVFILIVPLITTPYISRVLGANGVGQYSFTSSLTNYFTLVAALGFGYYAQREIAKFQGDKKSQSVIFWEILIVRFFSVGISLGVCIVLNVIGVYGEYSALMWWWVILIIAQEFDISFLFQGNEEFGKIVIRNVLIKLVLIACVFIFVKSADDVYIYVLCSAGSTLLGNLSLWLHLPKMLAKCGLAELKPIRHLLPTLRLFLPTIATSIYTVLDKTLIGLVITDTYTVVENGVEVVKNYSDLENGYYEQSEKIVKVCMAVVTALGTVMIPRNSNEYAKGNMDGVKQNVYMATNFVWFLGTPLMLGLAAVAGNVIPWFLGDGYEKCILLMQIFTPLILIIGFSNVFGLQYLVPTQRDGKFTAAIVSGAVVNFALNMVLIHFFWSYGAVIASIIAEFVVTAVMAVIIRKEISVIKILKQSIKYLIAGGVMFAAVYITQMYLSASILHTLLLVLEGAAIYFVMLLVLRDAYLRGLILKILAKLKAIRKNKRD